MSDAECTTDLGEFIDTYTKGLLEMTEGQRDEVMTAVIGGVTKVLTERLNQSQEQTKEAEERLFGFKNLVSRFNDRPKGCN